MRVHMVIKWMISFLFIEIIIIVIIYWPLQLAYTLLRYQYRQEAHVERQTCCIGTNLPSLSLFLNV